MAEKLKKRKRICSLRNLFHKEKKFKILQKENVFQVNWNDSNERLATHGAKKEIDIWMEEAN